MFSRSLQYEENLSLLNPLYNAPITSTHYHYETFLFHLARAYYQQALDLFVFVCRFENRISQGRSEYALVVLNTALERVNEAHRELGYCASILDLKACVLRLKYSLLSSFLNTSELVSLGKEQRIVNQQRLFLDPSNLQGWYNRFCWLKIGRIGWTMNPWRFAVTSQAIH